MYPAWDTWQHVIIEACWKVVWQKGEKTLPGPATGCQFFFVVNKHNNTMKPQAKKQQFSNLSQKGNSSKWRQKK